MCSWAVILLLFCCWLISAPVPVYMSENSVRPIRSLWLVNSNSQESGDLTSRPLHELVSHSIVFVPQNTKYFAEYRYMISNNNTPALFHHKKINLLNKSMSIYFFNSFISPDMKKVLQTLSILRLDIWHVIWFQLYAIYRNLKEMFRKVGPTCIWYLG